MILFKKASELHKWLEIQRKNGKTIGFVPTMGALHKGHLSLVDAAIKANDIALASIFVNPTQFNDPNDFVKYPVTIERDIESLEAAGCNILFLPSVAEIYPEGINSDQSQVYDLGQLERVFEGAYRPGHFQGVCRVVERLTRIVIPHTIFLGQKDYQQCMVIRKLFSLPGQLPVTIIVHPTLREPNGLAMSSRNMRLSAEEREKAAEIYKCFQFIRDHITNSDTSDLLQTATQRLRDNGFKPDYIAIADAQDLSPILTWDGKQPAVILAAAWLGEVRLIDNMPLSEPQA